MPSQFHRIKMLLSYNLNTRLLMKVQSSRQKKGDDLCKAVTSNKNIILFFYKAVERSPSKSVLLRSLSKSKTVLRVIQVSIQVGSVSAV